MYGEKQRKKKLWCGIMERRLDLAFKSPVWKIIYYP